MRTIAGCTFQTIDLRWGIRSEGAEALKHDVEATGWEEKARAVCSENWILESILSHFEKLKALLADSPLKRLRS